MSWYSLSCQKEEPVDCIGTAIVPLDAINNEKIAFSEKIAYELKDFLSSEWVKNPSFILIPNTEIDPDVIGKEIVLTATKIGQNENCLIVQFVSDEIENSPAINMIIATKNNIQNDDISNWEPIKNFSLYCFIAGVDSNYSIIF